MTAQITAAALYEAADRIRALFPDRPLLEVDFYQQSNGKIAVYAGKATKMRRMVQNARTIAEAEMRIVRRLAEQDHEIA